MAVCDEVELGLRGARRMANDNAVPTQNNLFERTITCTIVSMLFFVKIFFKFMPASKTSFNRLRPDALAAIHRSPPPPLLMVACHTCHDDVSRSKSHRQIRNV